MAPSPCTPCWSSACPPARRARPGPVVWTHAPLGDALVDGTPSDLDVGADNDGAAGALDTGPGRQGPKLAIGYFPLSQALSRDQAFAKVKEVADVVLIQRHWQESSNEGGLDFHAAAGAAVAAARVAGLQVYLALEPLSVNRDRVELPAGLTGDFGTPAVRTAYVDLVTRVAADYRPDYFLINIEVNRYRNRNPTDYRNYLSLFRVAYAAIKGVSPGTRVAASLSYEDVNGTDCFDAEDRDHFEGALAELGQQDFAAISLYPFCYFQPARIPESLLHEITQSTPLPILISETAWVSESFPVTDQFTFESSPQMQSEYVDKLAALVRYAVDHGRAVAGVVYVSLIDMDAATCDLLTRVNPSLSWYCSLSLLDREGAAKPAFGALEAWHDSMR